MSVDKFQVLDKLGGELSKPVSFRELVRALKIEDRAERRQLTTALRELVKGGEVIRLRGGRFGLPRRMNLVAGILKCTTKGYGFVCPDRSEVPDVFVREAQMKGALHGDRVVARIERQKNDGRVSGSVIRILERANSTVIGRLQRGPGHAYVLPNDPRLLTEVIVGLDEAGAIREGMIVEVEVIEYPGRHRTATGRIKDVIGHPDDPDVDLELVLRRHNLPREFPAAVRKEDRRISADGIEAELAERTDFRAQTIITIDGDKARDFDDAIGIKRTARGGFELGVHIADVSHYVRPGSAIDEEALARSTSTYFPTQVIPMLPEELSNDVCSLRPREDRLTLSVIVGLDRHAELESIELHRGIIRSKERMTYGDVQRILVDNDKALSKRYGHILEELKQMARLAKLLAGRRRRRGSIDFDLPAPVIVMDRGGEMTGIKRSERLFSHNIIEEFMILANEVVAQSLVEQETPALFRIHEAPRPTDVEVLNGTLKLVGLNVDGASPQSFRRVMAKAHGRPEERLVNTVCLRTMQLARYEPTNQGHFGLASEAYLHFTSPIRRYPDLVVHRVVKEAFLGEGEPVPGEEELEKLADQCSTRERVSEEAERELIGRKKVRFMADKVGEVFSATVVAVESFGFFVELDEYFVDGLVHLTSLHDDYYVHDERRHRLVGEATGRGFGLGDRLEVEVLEVNMMRRQIDFKLVGDKS